VLLFGIYFFVPRFIFGVGGLLRWLLGRFVGLGDVGEGDVVVFDTSSLSHAFEGFAHASISAYLEMGEPRVWSRLKARLERRFGSEEVSRRAVLLCDRASCMMPIGVWRELSSVPAFRESLDVVMGGGTAVEARYVRRKSGRGVAIGFSTVFKPRIRVRDARPELVAYVEAIARRLGRRLSRADAEGIALAIETNAILVTADKNQAEVADKLGVRVLYTIPPRKVELTVKQG